MGEYDLPRFLYRDLNGEIRIGYHGDSIITEEWNEWIERMNENLG